MLIKDLMRNSIAVKVEGRISWTHASHCRKVPSLRMEAQGETSAAVPDEGKAALNCGLKTCREPMVATYQRKEKIRN